MPARPLTTIGAVPPGHYNRVLAALPQDERLELARHLVPVSLGFKQVLYSRDRRIDHVYFPETAVCSLITVMSDGECAEAGTIGNDGVLGADLALGARHAAYETIVQVDGWAWRMSADAFVRQLAGSSSLRDLVHRHVAALLVQSFQSTACNRLHTLRERVCRWLLLTHDRAGRDEFRLTQDLLAVMAGVRRPSITGILTVLQREGPIERGRGRIRIRDRVALEAASCECYEAVRDQVERLTASGAGPSVRHRTDRPAATG
jgi:CRP-like cAMP-binding protein